MVSDSDPYIVGKKALDERPLDSTAEAKKTAQLLNKLTNHFHKVLKNHPVNIEREKAGLLPANIVLCRGAGKLPDLKQFPLQYGVNAVAQAAHIADPSGGATQDTEARTAINAILVALENIGITAPA